MATLTALSLLAGSAALVLGGNIAGKIGNPTETPAPEEPQAPEPMPEQIPAVTAPMPEPAEQAPAPPPPEQAAPPPPAPEVDDNPTAPVNQAGGGAIGRPKWGVISSTVLAPQDTTLGATVTSALGIREDPRDLNAQIIKVERDLEAANFSGFILDKKIADLLGKYRVVRGIFAEKFAQSKNYELTAADYLKKLNSQGQQNVEGKKALTRIISDNSKSAAEKDEARKKLAEMGQAKEVPEATLEDWRKKYTSATSKKIEADDDKTDAERDKNKYFAELTDLRTKKDEQEKLVKDLVVKRTALLKRLQAVLEEKKKKEVQPVDMPARTARYAKAIATLKMAEDNLRRFYTNTWLPLEGMTSQPTYRGQFDSLQAAWRNAKAEVEFARAALTAPTQVSTSETDDDFSTFVSDIADLTVDAVDGKGVIRDNFRWGGDTAPTAEPGNAVRKAGYPKDVKTLKEYAAKPKLRIAASVYYEIAKMDTTTLIRNTPRFLEYFKKLKGSTLGLRSERDKSTGDITQDLLRKFTRSILGFAANSVRMYPPPGEIDQTSQPQILYAQLREKTNIFVDKQVYLLKKMFKVVEDAKKTTKPSSIEGKNLLALEQTLKELYPVLPGLPPKGQCELLFKPSMFAALSTGIFKGESIIDKVLDDPDLKDEFLDAIGFVKVSNLVEAQEYARKPGVTRETAIDLIRKAVFEEYTKNAERLAFEDPVGSSYVRAAGDWTFLSGINNFAHLTTQRLDQLLPLPTVGTRVFNTVRAQQLRTEANLHPFIPGVFLEGQRTAADGTRSIGIEPLITFRNACELDGNVGQGIEKTTRILEILDHLANMEISPKEEESPLLKMIKKLEEKKKIDITRQDQAEPRSSLAQHGFSVVPGIGNWIVVDVTDDKELNFVETFLTFRSAKFRSIPYKDTIVYRGKTRNTREVYAELALAEIRKTPSFETRPAVPLFPDDTDWQRLSDDFNMNFIIYSDNKGVGQADMSMAGRLNAGVFSIFKSKSNKYYPIMMNAGPGLAPANPPGVNRPNVSTFNRGMLGGAIDGVTFPVEIMTPDKTFKEDFKEKVVKPAKEFGKSANDAIYNRVIPPLTNFFVSKPPPAAAPAAAPVVAAAPAPAAAPVVAAAPAPAAAPVGATGATAAPVGATGATAAPVGATGATAGPQPGAAAVVAAPVVAAAPVGAAAAAPVGAAADPAALAGATAAPPPGAGTGLRTGGRRKTTTNWRRSKPVRYTRRKF